MKNLLPIIPVLAAGFIVSGGSANPEEYINPNQNVKNNVSCLQETVNRYGNLNEKILNSKALGRYNLSISMPDALLVNAETKNSNNNELLETKDIKNNELKTDETVKEDVKTNISAITLENKKITEKTANNATTNSTTSEIETEDTTIKNSNKSIQQNNNIQTLEETTESIEINEDVNKEIENTESNEENNENITLNKEISTLYSISTDVDEACDEFCDLKEDLTEAILETQNLIKKVQSNEIELDEEQKLMLTQQSNELKLLSNELSRLTNELSVSLSDLGRLFTDENGNLDAISLKYLIILDNLMNGNSMLANGLYSINSMNSMLNNSNQPTPYGNGRFSYRLQYNNEPPITKDIKFDNNGNIIENNSSSNSTKSTEVNNTDNTQTNNTTKNSTIDSYTKLAKKSNIDTYYGNTPRNIDTFFNTALMDNEFMFGNGYGAYTDGYGGFAGGVNNAYGGGYFPYGYRQYQANQQNYNNTNYDVNNNVETQDMETTTKTEKKDKKLILAKNIDTYVDKDAPTLSAKFNNFKKSVKEFFYKMTSPKKDDSLKNPVYKFEDEQTTKN